LICIDSYPFTRDIIESGTMLIIRNSLQILPLILLLLAGQLQAQPNFSCSIQMDMNSSETSQHDHKSCPSSDYDDSSKLNILVSDLVIELDVDPSEEKLITYNSISQLRATTLLNNFSYTSYFHSGSKIHLITQRLRI
jgi:hypothetical protein